MHKEMPILVIDDSATMRSIIVKQLGTLGFSNVDLAEDGNSALALLQNRRYELVISDWEMQPMGGEEFLKRLRQDSNSAMLPVILVTATATRGASWLAGANAYLAKPFSETDLQKAMNAACAPQSR